MLDVVEASRGHWRYILISFGIGSDFLKNEHGPCPICGGKDRFRFDDQLNGRWICNRCGSGDGFRFLEKKFGWLFKDACIKIKQSLSIQDHEDDPEIKNHENKKAVMNRWWAESEPITPGDLGSIYLESRCKPISKELIRDFRLHRNLYFNGEKHPAILALLRDNSLKPCGIQRIFLDQNAHKIGKKSYGNIGSGCQLGPIGKESVIVAEGIETTLCACHIYHLSGWATLSASTMKTWHPPAEVKKVLICADSDRSYVGQIAAFTLGEKLVSSGIEVDIKIPEIKGEDFADIYFREVLSGKENQ